MWLYLLSNLNMGGGGITVTVTPYADPRQGSILNTDNLNAGVDPRQGSVISLTGYADPRKGAVVTS